MVVVLLMALGAVTGVVLLPKGPAGGPAAPTAATATPSAPAGIAPHSGSDRAPATALSPAAAVTHGDLVVTPGETFTIQPYSGNQTYFQGGNITVMAGGTLILRNTSLSFVQFIPNEGPLSNQLSYIYRFVDAGTVEFYNSTLTTNPVPINAVAKLFVNITGTWLAWNSTFEFPGWVVIHGSSADASFYQSSFHSNTGYVEGVRDISSVVYNDSVYAPTLNVTDGATLNLFGSSYLDTYADNTASAGFPNSQPIATTSFVWLNTTADRDVPNSAFSIPGGASPAELVQDMLYPAQASSISLTADYDNTGATTVDATVALVYNGVPYTLGNLSFAPGTGAAGETTTPDAAILSAMYLNGAPFYLSTGVDFTSVSEPPATTDVNITSIELTMVPRLDYNLTASGTGTTLDLVNTALDLNWSAPSELRPFLSAKLDLTTGAVANLANLTVTQLPYFQSNPGQASAIAVFPGSVANFYRWAAMNFTGGPDGILGIYNTAVIAAYAYNDNQTNNATANALYAGLTTAGSPIKGYADYLAATSGQLGYGVTGAAGQTEILLPAGQMTTASEPDGVYLGNWHVAVETPFTTGKPTWFYGSVLPYPEGVANGTAGYGSADYWTPTYFAQYDVSPSIGPITVTANGSAAPNNTVRIGQVLGINVTFSNHGYAPVYTLLGGLSWSNTSKGVLSTVDHYNVAIAGGQGIVSPFGWFVNDSNISMQVDKGKPFTQEFYGLFLWFGSKNGSKTPYLGVDSFYVNVTILQSEIRVVSASAPPPTVQLDQQYLTSGNLRYNGSFPAEITLEAIPKGSVQPIEVGASTSLPGPFSIAWTNPLSSVLSQGTTYTFEVVASYNGVTTTYIVGTFSTPAPPTNPWGILTETFLGLPLWVWLAIAAAIVVGVVAFLLIARRQAAGRLVECGECGSLIPEEATVCPKCGAQFEQDLIRCSRCASTIPADSKVCPECAAVLLGKPGDAAADPEIQGYNDFTEKYRAEAKRELGDNYSEGAFWDWWKRQPTYTSFSQWKLQQGTGTSRAGMTAPPPGGGPGAPPGAGGVAAAPAAAAAAGSTVPPPPPPPGGAPPSPPPAAGAVAAAGATGAAIPPAPAAGGGLKACPSCGKEIPAEYVVCPFCSAVTQ